MTPGEAPLVDVFKTDWLPGSETFIRTQTGALTRWRHRCVGFDRVDSPLARTDDVLVGDPGGLERFWRGSPPDLVHVHWATEGVEILPLLERLGLPLVVTTHGMDVSRRRFGTAEQDVLHRDRVRAVLQAAEAVVCPSHHLASRAVAAGAPPENVRVRYIGVPVPEAVGTGDGAPGTDGVPDGGGVDVAVVARLVPVKGVDDVVRACGIASKLLGRELTVAVAGDGPDRERIEAVAARQPGVDLELHGRIPHRDVGRLLAGSRLVVGGSRVDDDGAREGFGLGLLEAAAHGRPVVAYDSGGVAEAVLHEVTGLLVPELDVDGLGAAIARVLGDPEWAGRLGAAGRRRVVEEFDVRDRTRELEAVYDEVLGRTR